MKGWAKLERHYPISISVQELCAVATKLGSELRNWMESCLRNGHTQLQAELPFHLRRVTALTQVAAFGPVWTMAQDQILDCHPSAEQLAQREPFPFKLQAGLHPDPSITTRFRVPNGLPRRHGCVSCALVGSSFSLANQCQHGSASLSLQLSSQ